MPGIVEVYKKTRKQRDLFMNLYFFRPLATPIVWALGGTGVTPNQVTFASFLAAMGAVVILASWPGYAGLVVGVGVYAFSYVLDCVDGMLARLKGLQSTPGHLFDFLMDEIKAFFILGVAAYRLWKESGGDDSFLLLGIAGLTFLATGIAVTTFERRPEIAAPRPSAAPDAPPPSLFKQAVGLPVAFLKLLVHYPSYILFVAIAGRLELYFYPYVAVNALYAARCIAVLALKFGRR